MNPLGFIQIGAYSLNGIMIYVYISVPVIVYSIMFLVRFPRCVHDNFIKIVSSLYPQGAWLDVQRELSQYFSSEGEFAYFYNDCLYISFITHSMKHFYLNHEPEKILKFHSHHPLIANYILCRDTNSRNNLHFRVEICSNPPSPIIASHSPLSHLYGA